VNPVQKRKLKAAFELLTVVCDDVSDTMPVRQVLSFLAVAILSAEGKDGTADLRDVAKEINSPGAVASRDLLVLGKRSRQGTAGHDLVEVKEDYTDLRRRPYRLTAKGSAVVNKLTEAL
jgi:DNA-binding MarR family transcriptional regulator